MPLQDQSAIQPLSNADLHQAMDRRLSTGFLADYHYTVLTGGSLGSTPEASLCFQAVRGSQLVEAGMTIRFDGNSTRGELPGCVIQDSPLFPCAPQAVVAAEGSAVCLRIADHNPSPVSRRLRFYCHAAGDLEIDSAWRNLVALPWSRGSEVLQPAEAGSEGALRPDIIAACPFQQHIAELEIPADLGQEQQLLELRVELGCPRLAASIAQTLATALWTNPLVAIDAVCLHATDVADGHLLSNQFHGHTGCAIQLIHGHRSEPGLARIPLAVNPYREPGLLPESEFELIEETAGWQLKLFARPGARTRLTLAYLLRIPGETADGELGLLENYPEVCVQASKARSRGRYCAIERIISDQYWPNGPTNAGTLAGLLESLHNVSPPLLAEHTVEVRHRSVWAPVPGHPGRAATATELQIVTRTEDLPGELLTTLASQCDALQRRLENTMPFGTAVYIRLVQEIL